MKHKISNSSGFTMVELLAVAIVMIGVISIISAILSSSLRGVSKSNVTDAVRQSGNSAISIFARDVKFAKTFEGVSPDGNTYYTDCSSYRSPLTPTPSPTPARLPYKYIKITSIDGDKIIFSCEGDSLYETINGTKRSLLPTDSVKLTSLGECYITCNQNVVTDPPTIGLHFNLSQAADDNATFFERESSAEFQTSVTFRNLNK